jgi:hypothetical protein
MRKGILFLLVLMTNAFAMKTDVHQLNRGEELRLSDISVDAAELRYGPYVVRKGHRQVRMGYASKGRHVVFADDEYAILRRQGKTIARFDGIHGPIGNNIEFGVSSLLGHGPKQLLVSQDIFRGGRQWVVSLGKRPRVIYDGRKWLTGREGDDLSIVDLNGDGVYELVMPDCVFYGFEGLFPAGTPLPRTILNTQQSRRSIYRQI